MARDQLIDLFRGLDLLEMQIVESSDSPIFDHADYHSMKMTYADTIFPCFAFISGMTTRPHTVTPLRKSLQLIGLGVAYNAIPSTLEGQKLRFLGVLQRHGLSSVILNNLVPASLRNSTNYPIVMTAIWSTLSVLGARNKSDPFTKPEDTAQQRIDYPIFGDRTYNNNFDPEGLLGALMTSVTIWSGYWVSQQNFTAKQALYWGIGSWELGKLLAYISPKYLPVSKPLWTPTFVLKSNGISLFRYAFLKYSLPYLPAIVTETLAIFGSHSMEVYFIGELLLSLLKHPFSTKSLWKKAETALNKVFSPRVTEAVLVSVFNVALLGIARFCNAYGLKIRFY